MKNRLFSAERPKDFIRQNSDVNLDKDSAKLKQLREMREMKSVNKQLGSKKKHFFFQQGEKIVGDYKFDARKQIGSGYSSKVYKAISIKDNLEYAIKAVELNSFKQSHFEMLQNEIKILKKMNHPNIIKFCSVSQTKTHLYIITEFCQKGDLLTYMTRKGVLCETEALEIFSDILKGMQYLQKFGIIHRDIKPGNILFDGKKWKIADFGFSLESREEVKTRNNVGTPLYMPLESLEKNLYSSESDIFSVGVVLYELLVGITPWECRDEEELMRKLNNIGFRIPQKVKLSSQIKQLLKRMCQPFKEKRMTRKQFLNLDPATFENLEPVTNIFRKQTVDESKQQLLSSQIKKDLGNITFVGELKIKILEEKIELKSKNDSNLFTNGKMKRSSENVKSDRQIPSKGLLKIKSAENLFTSLPQQSPNNEQTEVKNPAMTLKQGTEKTNRNILLNALNFCRFMFYLMKNADYFDINELNRQKIKIILIKHSLSILRQLSDTQKNWFNLSNYEQYKETRNAHKIFRSFQQYLIKYEKQYQSLMRKVEAGVVKEVNQKFSEFIMEEPVYLREGFHKKLLNVIGPILRENNHNLATEIFNTKKKFINDDTKFKIEALRQFHKYYRLVETLAKQNGSFQNLQQNNIEVLKTYGDTKVTVDDYMNLRKDMKFI